MKIGQYYYELRGRQFRIYQVDSSFSAKATEYIFNTREEARNKVYELNGWKKK